MRTRDRTALLRHQNDSLRRLLVHVWNHSPFYRNYYAAHGIKERDLPELGVRDLPFVTKRTLMDQFDAAVTDARLRRRDLEHWLEHRSPEEAFYGDFLLQVTSGSSGDVGLFAYDRASVRTMNTTMAERLPGPENPSGRTKVVSYMPRAAALMPKTIYDVVLLDLLEPIERIVSKLNQFQPHRVVSYSSHTAQLAEAAIRGDLRIHPASIVLTGDALSAAMEEKIRNVWNASITELYCCSESTYVAVKENGQAEMNVMDDLNILEVLDDENQPCPEGCVGRVVLSNLYNVTLPVLRYELGDYARRGAADSAGPFSRIRDIRGRVNDALPVVRRDGTRASVHPITLSLFYVAGLERIQFISLRPDRVRIEYVAATDVADSISKAFQEILNSARAAQTAFDVHRVQHIPNDPNTGKFRLIKIG